MIDLPKLSGLAEVIAFRAPRLPHGGCDELRFDPTTVTAERITEDADYEGIRVKFLGYLGNAKIPIQIDLGFGDVVMRAPIETELSSLLDAGQAKVTYPSTRERRGGEVRSDGQPRIGQ